MAQVKMYEEEWTMPTYEVAPPDKNPMFFKGESYQGASKVIYPYGMNDVISNTKTDKAWKALILENEYIKLCVTPEIGGKLYYATDKTDGYNFIYKNDVVKPSNIGMLGAWVSGGTEWCVIHHHRASTMLPVDYCMKENPDGSKTLWIGETELRHRMRWTIGITVYPGKSYYSADVKIINSTPVTNTFLYWANVAAHTDKDYQVIFPPSINIATYHAKNSFTHWPVSTDIYNGYDFTRGVDLSWWVNSVFQDSYFAYDMKEDFMGGYDHGKEAGTVEIGDHNIVKGAKLWEWGSGPQGQATEARLTENAGPYVEIMTGAFSDNQPDYSWIRPYEVKTFRQYWYPVKDIKGFKNANINGAVNLEKNDSNHVFLGYYSTQKVRNANIILKKHGNVVYSKTTDISPEKPFTTTIKLEDDFKITDLSTEMINPDNDEVLVSYKPVETKRADKLPETVKRPPAPKDIKTVEELYLTGSRIQQFYNPTLNAMDYFKEALKRDPLDCRTNIAVGSIYLKNGDYNNAKCYFCHALQRLTKDYTRPSTCEPFYLDGLALKALGKYDNAADTLYRATWDYAWHSAAYLQLAKISCIKGDMNKALGQIEQSLSTNAENNVAVDLKATIQRKTGNSAGALATLRSTLENDPLDFRAENESYLLALKKSDKAVSDRILNDLNSKMRDYDQNYLELAVGYMDDGMPDEAENVLLRFKGKNQIIYYYLGYLSAMKGNRDKAVKYFSEGSAQPVDYGFPFRLETVKILLMASEYNPEDSRPYYYLGNLLYDKQPEKAIEYWEKAVRYEPTLAIAWRNLGWAYYRFNGDNAKAIAAYEKAISFKKDDPVYYAELDPIYELNNTPVTKRLSLFADAGDVVKKRDDSFVREIIVLNLAGEYRKAVEALDNSNFHFREGSSRVRDISVDAHILYGRQLMKNKKYKQALAMFSSLNREPGNAGEDLSDYRSSQINYFVGLALEALSRKDEARKYFEKSAAQKYPNVSYLSYWQGLSYLKLGQKKMAEDIFKSLISAGEKIINQGEDVDFFAKFGEREGRNQQLSDAHLLKGLGEKGLGNMNEAETDLKISTDLSASNLWAGFELNK